MLDDQYGTVSESKEGKADMKKIAIMATKIPSVRELFVFEKLYGQLNIHVFADKAVMNLGVKTWLKVTLLDCQHVKSKELEIQLRSFDAIIILDPGCAVSWLAVRIGRKLGINVISFVHNLRALRQWEYRNLKTATVDIIHSADQLWVPSSSTQDDIKYLIEDTTKVQKVVPPVDYFRFAQSLEKRNRFRAYLGIKQDDLVVFYLGQFLEPTYAENLMLAVKMLKENDRTRFGNIKIMYIGDGEISQKLKYLAYDSGLGSSIFFLHQDTENFRDELFNCADIAAGFYDSIVTGYSDANTFKEVSCSGCATLVDKGSSFCHLANGPMVEIDDYSYTELARGIEQAVLGKFSKMSSKESPYSSKDQIFDLVNEVLLREAQGLPTVEEIAETIIAGRTLDAMVQIEEALTGENSAATKSELLRLKAELIQSSGEFVEAEKLLRLSIDLNPGSHKSLRDLGFVLLQCSDYREAKSFFERACAIYDGDEKALYGYGLACRYLGEVDKALYWLELSMQKNATKQSKIIFAQTCLQLQDIDQAILRLEAVIDTFGESKAFLLSLSQLEASRGCFEKANQLLEVVASKKIWL